MPAKIQDELPMQETATLVPTTPMQLIAIAAQDEKYDVEKLKALFELQMRWEANEAKKAYTVAMTAFKENPPAITKNRHVSYTTKSGGVVKFDHATLDEVCDKIIEALSKHGISHRWEVQQDSDAAKNWMSIKVKCILTHAQGHSERTTLAGPPEDSGVKNALQAIGSTITYLERYTLLAATGLATEGQDDDGQGSSGEAKTKLLDLEERLHWIKDANNLETMRKTFGESWEAASSIGDEDAMKKLVEARDARKRELVNAPR